MLVEDDARALASSKSWIVAREVSRTDPGSTGPFYAGEGDIKVQLGPRTGYDYWVIRGEYMTNNGKNVVVGGNKSGNDDQIWKAF